MRRYLDLRTLYPLPEDIKIQIFASIRQLPRAIRNQWITQPEIYYEPFDHIELFHTYETDFIFRRMHQPYIHQFFVGTGCKRLLLDRLINIGRFNLRTGFYWAILTQDPDLFRRLWELCSRQPQDPRVQDNLNEYSAHLDRTDRIQAQLAGLARSE